MARFGNDQIDNGHLDVRNAAASARIEAYFIPTETPDKDSPASRRLAKGVKLVDFDPETGLVMIHPINTLATHSGYLGPKYEKVRTLTLETALLEDYYEDADIKSIFEALPSGFVKDFAYGLGLLKDCNRLIRLIEANTPCGEIVFSNGNSAMIEGTRFHLGLSRFASIWSEIGRINDRGNRAAGRVKDVFVHNNLAATLGLSTAEFSLGRHPDSRVIAKAADGIEELSEIERDALIGAVASESAAIAENAPEKFQQLKRDIELVSLDHLIETYATSLDEGKSERYWQTFFDDNAFAL